MTEMTFEEKRRRLEVLGRVNNWSEAEFQERLKRLKEEPQSRRASPLSPAPGSGDEVEPALRVAPYRFVEIADVVVMPPASVSKALMHDPPNVGDKPLKEGFCGEIKIRWEAETPLLIGQSDRSKEGDVWTPLRLGQNGDWWIPGASFRGMVRSAAEIVGHARLEQVNREHVFALRDFEHRNYNSEDGLGLGRPGAVKAGWLWKRSGDDDEVGEWAIEPSDLAYVEIRDLIGHLGSQHDPASWIRLGLDAKYQAAGMRPSGQITFEGRPSKFDAAASTSQGQPRVTPSANGLRGGVLVFSGATPAQRPGAQQARSPKHLEYAFMTLPGSRQDKEVVLDAAAFKRFHYVHTTQGAKRREPIGSWKALEPLARAGKPIPVFYVGDLDKQDPRHFAFGLTRLFRVPHRLSVGERMAKTLPHHASLAPGANAYEPDFVSALFGFVREPTDVREDLPQEFDLDSLALKGRVAFSGARIAAGEAEPTDTISTINMAPRLSFAPFYLAGRDKDWSSDDATFAGRKRYLPRATGSGDELEAIRRRLKAQIDVLPEYVRTNAAAQTRLRFLAPRPGARLQFNSRLRLHNVTAEEIGLILFVLTHGGDPAKRFRHMIGRAKPYGVGQLRVVSAQLDLEANTTAGLGRLKEPKADEVPAEAHEGFCPTADKSASVGDYGRRNVSHRPFLEALKTHMCDSASRRGASNEAKLDDFPNCPAVLAFLGASDPTEGARLQKAHHGALESLYLPVSDHRRLKTATQIDKALGRAKSTRPRRLLPAPESKEPRDG